MAELLRLIAVGVKRLHHLMYLDDDYPNKIEEEVMLTKRHGREYKSVLG